MSTGTKYRGANAETGEVVVTMVTPPLPPSSRVSDPQRSPLGGRVRPAPHQTICRRLIGCDVGRASRGEADGGF